MMVLTDVSWKVRRLWVTGLALGVISGAVVASPADAGAAGSSSVNAKQKRVIKRLAKTGKKARVSVVQTSGAGSGQVQNLSVDLKRAGTGGVQAPSLQPGASYRVKLNLPGVSDPVQRFTVPQRTATPRIGIGDVSTAPKIANVPPLFGFDPVFFSPWSSYIASDLPLPTIDQFEMLGALFNPSTIPGLITSKVGNSIAALLGGALGNLTTVLQYRENSGQWQDAALVPWANHAFLVKQDFGFYVQEFRRRQLIGTDVSPVTTRYTLVIPFVSVGNLLNLASGA